MAGLLQGLPGDFVAFSGDNLQVIDFRALRSVDKIDNIVSFLPCTGYLKIRGLRVRI
jgi:hypothetical protein